MSEEEKRAIEILEDFKKYGYYKIQIENDVNRARTTHLIENSLDIILNLISNLQKELDKKDKEIKQLRNTILNYQGTTGILLKMEDKDE